MTYNVPKEFDTARQREFYIAGYKETRFRTDYILDTHQIMTDEERRSYYRGRTDGALARKKLNG